MFKIFKTIQQSCGNPRCACQTVAVTLSLKGTTSNAAKPCNVVCVPSLRQLPLSSMCVCAFVCAVASRVCQQRKTQVVKTKDQPLAA